MLLFNSEKCWAALFLFGTLITKNELVNTLYVSTNATWDELRPSNLGFIYAVVKFITRHESESTETDFSRTPQYLLSDTLHVWQDFFIRNIFLLSAPLLRVQFRDLQQLQDKKLKATFGVRHCSHYHSPSYFYLLKALQSFLTLFPRDLPTDQLEVRDKLLKC